MKSTLRVEKKNASSEPNLQWRLQPKLCCEFSFVQFISPPVAVDTGYQFSFMFQDFKLTLEIDDTKNAELASEIHACLNNYMQKAKSIQKLEKDQNTQKGTNQQTSSYQQTISLRKAIADAAQKEEQMIQLCFFLRYKESYMIVEKVHMHFTEEWKRSAFAHWVRVVKDENTEKMIKDRHRWRLHGTANQEIDLQAWYHALFYLEVQLDCTFSLIF